MFAAVAAAEALVGLNLELGQVTLQSVLVVGFGFILLSLSWGVT